MGNNNNKMQAIFFVWTELIVQYTELGAIQDYYYFQTKLLCFYTV